MNVEPVERYSTPKLPTRDIVDARPELLRQVPKRWQSNTLVISALTTAGMLVAGCRGSKEPAVRVAPVFAHGEGRGWFGCVAINPPEFLSEDEARQVVIEEARNAGIHFKPNGRRVDHIRVPVTNETEHYWDHDDEKLDKPPASRLGGITLDGSDGKRNIHFEVVTGADFKQWLAVLGMSGATAWKNEPIVAARVLQKGLRKARAKGVYGVFYDPGIGIQDAAKAGLYTWPDYDDPQRDWEADLAKSRAATSKLAREELREQVRDFVKWLKAQGVI